MLQRLMFSMLLLAGCASAQRHVNAADTHHRLICVVPMIGKGTPADPKRPQYTPWPPSQKAKGIISFTSQVSDDGKFALVEFAALDDSAFAQILNDKTVKAFEKGKASKADIVLELKKYKRDFDLDKFGAVAR